MRIRVVHLKVDFFPLNVTSLYQPIDQGIIRRFQNLTIIGSFFYISEKEVEQEDIGPKISQVEALELVDKLISYEEQ